MFSQTLVNLLNHDPEFHGALISELDKASRAVFKDILTGYGFWNLDYFCYLICHSPQEDASFYFHVYITQ